MPREFDPIYRRNLGIIGAAYRLPRSWDRRGQRLRRQWEARKAGRMAAVDVGRSFALDIEPVELVEERRECLREAQFALTRWERTRDPLDRARLLAAMMILSALVRR